MLIVTASQMADAEKKAFEIGCSDDAFMVLAGANIAKILQKLVKDQKIILLSGKGNNGGDAYVAGYILLKENYSVEAYHFSEIDQCTKLNQKYHLAFKETGGKTSYITDLEKLSFPDNAIIVDALLGTGFKGALRNTYLKVVEKINALKLTIVSIDIPSGLDGTTGNVKSLAIKADLTIYLGLLKTGFFLNDGPNYVGKLVPADFGLPKEIINQMDPFGFYFDKENVKLLEIDKKRHKYDKGYVLAVAGSSSMKGAAMLSAFATLRAGAGIVRLFSFDNEQKIDVRPFEIIQQTLCEESLDKFFNELQKAKVVFIGPGIGRDPSVEKIFLEIIKKIDIPMVLDADALFFLAKNPDIELCQDTILTPHHGEMLKILNEKSLDEEVLVEKTLAFAKKKKVIIVLKGATTFVFHYEFKPFVIASTTVALSTAGTGDVLTGIIAAQLTQKITPFQAAAQGAFIHGLAGQIAEKDKSTYSLVASDVIECLPKAFKLLKHYFDMK